MEDLITANMNVAGISMNGHHLIRKGKVINAIMLINCATVKQQGRKGTLNANGLLSESIFGLCSNYKVFKVNFAKIKRDYLHEREMSVAICT